jgi:hypothetical protein
VKGFVDHVAICGADEIARHSRIYGRGQFVFDPKHYLALLEQKPGALDQAAPLQNYAIDHPVEGSAHIDFRSPDAQVPPQWP